MNVSYFPYWNIVRHDSAISHTKGHVCRIIQSLYVADWGTSRLSQKQLPVLWVCNRRCQGALLSEHPAYPCISHIQTSLAAVSTGHVHKSDLWSLVRYEEMRSMPLVTFGKTWVPTVSPWTNTSAFNSCSAAEAQMQSNSQQNFPS